MLHKLLGMFSADGVEVLMRALFYSSDAALRVAIASTLTRLVEERPTHCKELLPPILFLALLEVRGISIHQPPLCSSSCMAE